MSRREAAAHLFVEDLESPEVAGEDRHHLERVLRLRVGETVSASTGDGRWRLATWRGGGLLDPSGPIDEEPAPQPAIGIALAAVKGERTEWAVARLTEIGVDVISVVVAERSIVRWEPARAERHLGRLQDVARQAAMQSRRVRVPVVKGPVLVADLATRPGWALAEPGGGPPSLDRPCLMVGPEGGWSDAELDLDLPRVALGSEVMRTETAAVAGGALMCALRAGLVAARGEEARQ